MGNLCIFDSWEDWSDIAHKLSKSRMTELSMQTMVWESHSHWHVIQRALSCSFMNRKNEGECLGAFLLGWPRHGRECDLSALHYGCHRFWSFLGCEKTMCSRGDNNSLNKKILCHFSTSLQCHSIAGIGLESIQGEICITNDELWGRIQWESGEVGDSWIQRCDWASGWC